MHKREYSDGAHCADQLLTSVSSYLCCLPFLWCLNVVNALGSTAALHHLWLQLVSAFRQIPQILSSVKGKNTSNYDLFLISTSDDFMSASTIWEPLETISSA